MKFFKDKHWWISAVGCLLIVFSGVAFQYWGASRSLSFGVESSRIYVSAAAPDPGYYLAAASDPPVPHFVNHPEDAQKVMTRAFIRTIMFAEGTYPNSKGMSPYDIIVGYFDLNSFKTAEEKWNAHPDVMINLTQNRPWRRGDPCSTRGDGDLCAAVAGSCQFQADTWDGYYRKYGWMWHKDLPPFHPRNQDVACAAIAYSTGALEALSASADVNAEGRIVVYDQDFYEAIHRGANQWASFPRHDGSGIGDATGQKKREREKLWEVFQKALEEEQAGFVPVAPVTAAPAPAPVESQAPATVGADQPQPMVGGKPEKIEDTFPEDLKAPAKDGQVVAGYTVTDIRKFREVHPVTGKARWHQGWDVGMDVGVPLKLPSPGETQCFDEGNKGYGRFSVIRLYDVPGREFLTAHLNDCASIKWNGEAEVAPVFGHSGNTGGSTGPHLHQEMHVQLDGKWQPVDFAAGWLAVFTTGKYPKAG